MLEQPNLPDVKIKTCLEQNYGLAVSGIQFLPIGNDSSAWVYRVDTVGSSAYFLKVKNGLVDPGSVLVPRYLKDHGLEQVVAAIPTINGLLWQPLQAFFLILYPFIDGRSGMEAGLTDQQWVEYGSFLRQLHAVVLQNELVSMLTYEMFIPKWSRVVREIQAKIAGNQVSDPYQKELAVFWSKRQDEIEKIAQRAEVLGRELQKKPHQNVLCHADIHTANLLISREAKMFVVDWDGVLLAPKERDLMFVVEAAVGGFSVRSKQEELFFKGYGITEIDPLALAYYRYEWVVQDIGDYGERVFLMPDVGDETKKASVQGLMAMFAPGDVVESAYLSERDI
jgi:spectinomycin phosphotransferase